MRPFDLPLAAARALAACTVACLPAAVAEAAARPGPDLRGVWAMTTTPPISVQQPRGKQVGTVMPIEVVFSSGVTPLAGTIEMWRGDTTRGGPLSGTLEGAALLMVGATFEFKGTFDPATGVVTGVVLELPGRVPPEGKVTRFRMTRSSAKAR